MDGFRFIFLLRDSENDLYFIDFLYPLFRMLHVLLEIAWLTLFGLISSHAPSLRSACGFSYQSQAYFAKLKETIYRYELTA